MKTIQMPYGWFSRFLVALFINGFIHGCGSSVDLDKEYGLTETASERGPAKTIASLLGTLESELNGREIAPANAVAGAKENIDSYNPSMFGEQAGEFEKILAGMNELQEMVEKKASRQQLVEKANALKNQADQMAAASTPAE